MKEGSSQEETAEKIAQRFSINLEKLKKEQIELSKQVNLKDSFKKEEINFVAGCDCAYSGNMIICSIVVLDKNLEIVEEKFVSRRVSFPYIPGYNAYRELPAMVECYEKLEESPDVFMVLGEGILHPRRLGIASHLGLIIGKPVIGISNTVSIGTIKNGIVYIDNEKRGQEVLTKEGSRPIIVSPGNMITLKTACEVVKMFVKEPHKLPEPLNAAHKHSNEVRGELNANINS